MAEFDITPEIQFGSGGTDRHYLGNGWSGDEPGYRWAVGESSELWLNNPGIGTNFRLELDVAPLVNPPTLLAQRLSVFVRDSLVGQAEIMEYGTVTFDIPMEILSDQGPVRVIFEHPDAAAPNQIGLHPTDVRRLALAFRHLRLRPAIREAADDEELSGERVSSGAIGALTGVPAAQFLERFESLGGDPEFGFVQRRCGAEGSGLLRFATATLEQLTRGLQDEFAGLGSPGDLEFRLATSQKSEYTVWDRNYDITFKTFLYHGDVNEAELVARQSTRLSFLRRKLLEDLARADRIFVYKQREPVDEARLLKLHSALNKYGPNRLLVVTPSSRQHPPGTAELVMPGLLRGYVDKLASPADPETISLESWLSVCVFAERLASK